MKEYFKPTLNYRKTYWKYWTSLPAEIYEWIRCFTQRGKQGYCYRDIWSIDYYLMEIIPPMIKELKRTTHGVPVGLTGEEWGCMLDKIVLGFEAGKRLADSENWVMNEGMSIDIDEHGACNELKIRKPWSTEQIKTFKELDEKDNKAFDEGMELFHKYFFNLWD
jgi:hypothetical protein